MIIIRCDVCKDQVPQPGQLPDGWRVHAEYRPNGAGRKVFIRMKHSCPDCPTDISRNAEEDVPLVTVQTGLREVEECARFALLNEEELNGMAREMVARAIAMLDEARARAEKETG